MTTPVGSITNAQENLRVMLADAAAFRAWVGAVDRAGALLSIYHEALPPPAGGAAVHTLAELQGLRPYAMVWTAEQQGFAKTRDATGSSICFKESGHLKLRLVQDVPPLIAGDPAEVDLQFKNTAGLIFDDVCALAGLPGYLAIESIGVDEGPFRGHEDDLGTQGDYQGIDLDVTWGVP